jgi:phosphonate metabolism-associated iron-containing alcohol dehydrogenase
MSAWTYHNPVDLRFGDGVIVEIGKLVAGRRYLLVTHPDAPMLPWREKVTALAGAPVAVVDAIEPNPSLSMLDGICQQLAAIDGTVDLVVALGGGSVIDSAKFLAAGHMQFEPVRDFLETGAVIDRAALPILAIPTTAGTGSDLTKWATIWDPETDRKLSLNRQDLYAEAVLVDPEITASLPWSMTRASGLDALSHALESIWNVNANPVTRTFAVAAARDILIALPRLQADLRDAEARGLMARGSTNAGLAFSNTQTALAHNISYPITLRHGVVHGIACSFSLPEVMVAARGIDAACDEALGNIFGDLEVAPARLRQFLSSLDVPADPAAMGVEAEEWQQVLEDAFAGPRGRNFLGTADRYPADSVC